MKKEIFKWVMAAALCLGLTAGLYAAEKVKKATQLKELQGVVTWIRKDKIAIVYRSDEATHSEEEILLPIGKDIQLVHKNSLSDISVGDTVSIQYEEVTEEGADGAVKSSRKAKAIIFVSPGFKKPIPAAQNPEPGQSQILKSQ